MFNKIAIILTLYGTFAVAQNSTYKTDNYTTWKVIDVDVKNKYLALKSRKEEELKEFKPICTNAKIWIFKYEMMGIDDSFYDEGSRSSSLVNITKSTEYTMKIDVEEDNLQRGSFSSMNKICRDHQAQMYFDSNGRNTHGIITYVGDKTISPPF